MVPFAGYEMPLHYAGGLIREHIHTRSLAGLFDVSHMGQIAITSQSGNLQTAAAALERLVSADILTLPPGRQRYALLTNDGGGIRDDLMVANLGDRLVLTVNAATKDSDEIYLKERLPAGCIVERLSDQALIALQGPSAESALGLLAPPTRQLKFMAVQRLAIAGVECLVARSGYTGEDGFEISVPNAHATSVASMLLHHPDVRLIGLGARDSLRLEAGLCLYGADIDDRTTPVEANLAWSIQKSRRVGGDRAGAFPGADIILSELANGPKRIRVGLLGQGRVPVRGGASLYPDETAPNSVGRVTSGGFGVSVGAPIAMAYLDANVARSHTRLLAEVRSVRHPVSIASMPFVPHNYKRA